MDFLNSVNQISAPVLFGIYVWSIIWKGLALWKAAGLAQRNWFVGLLVLNTLGILEIAYLFFFAKKKMTLSDLVFWQTK